MSDLTRDQLREALSEVGVASPANMRKDDLVALYEEHGLGVANGAGLIVMSTDDEDHEVSFGGKRKAMSKRASQSSRRSNANAANSSSLTEANSLLVDGRNVADLTDDELFTELKAFGVDVGPIVESTRTLYRKKLAILLRGENSGSGGHLNGSSSHAGANGLGAFSADEETEEDDDQPSAVVSPVSTGSRRSRAKDTPKKMEVVAETLTDIRKRFNSSFESPEKGGGRFTPTPRRSIHTYKVTETSKQTMVKSRDGNITHDYVYSKQTSEDTDRDLSMVNKVFGGAFRILPKLFFALVVVTFVFYVYVNHGDFISNNLIGYFPKSIEEVTSAETEAPAPVAQPQHVEQGSIGDV